jgi:hypothetical protein
MNRTSQEEGLAPAVWQERGQAPLPDLFHSKRFGSFMMFENLSESPAIHDTHGGPQHFAKEVSVKYG